MANNFAFPGKLNPATISLGLFVTSSNGTSYTFGPHGSGSTNVNPRPVNAPTIATPIAPVSVAVGASPTQIDLAGSFTSPDFTDSLVTFQTSDGPVQVELFDKADPQTVANFFDYIESGAYNDSIFHRDVQSTDTNTPGLSILQGGALTLNAAGNGFANIPILSPAGTGVPSEFPGTVPTKGVNVAGTIAMAQTSGNPNSGTDQFFFNTSSNTSSLDSQKFTVFGKILPASEAVLKALAATPHQTSLTNPTLTTDFPTADFGNVPLKNYKGSSTTFPGDAKASNFLVIKKVVFNKRSDSLSYSVLSNSNPTLVTPTITNEWLTPLTYAAGQHGSATIVLQAKNSFGATVTQTITVTAGRKPTQSAA